MTSNRPAPDTQRAPAGTVLVAGCGYLGRVLAGVLHGRGHRVIAVTRSERSAHALAATVPHPVLACDISAPAALRAVVVPALEGAPGPPVVIHCASSSRGDAAAYRKVYLSGAAALIDVLQPRLVVFTGSTSVYGQTSGETVTETSPATPVTPTGHVLRQVEDLVLARAGGRVARLAGLYGPGRSVILRRLLDGTARIEGDGSRIVNQIHRDDAADALALLACDSTPPGIYNVADDHPIPQIDLYTALARRFGTALPPRVPPDPTRKRGLSNKAVSNAKLRALGWVPAHPSFIEAPFEDGLLP